MSSHSTKKGQDILSKDSVNNTSNWSRDAFVSLFDKYQEDEGISQTDAIKRLSEYLPLGERQIYRWIKGEAVIPDKWHQKITDFFQYNTGERVRDTPTVNTPRGIDLQEVGNTGLTIESQAGESISDKITTLYELVYSLIPMQEMKNALERGDEVKTPFRFIFERDFQGDAFEIEFVAKVRKVKKPSPPDKRQPYH